MPSLVSVAVKSTVSEYIDRERQQIIVSVTGKDNIRQLQHTVIIMVKYSSNYFSSYINILCMRGRRVCTMHRTMVNIYYV